MRRSLVRIGLFVSPKTLHLATVITNKILGRQVLIEDTFFLLFFFFLAFLLIGFIWDIMEGGNPFEVDSTRQDWRGPAWNMVESRHWGDMGLLDAVQPFKRKWMVHRSSIIARGFSVRCSHMRKVMLELVGWGT